jgi:hypothetical protein
MVDLLAKLRLANKSCFSNNLKSLISSKKFITFESNKPMNLKSFISLFAAFSCCEEATCCVTAKRRGS